jgi:hypothetical protein
MSRAVGAGEMRHLRHGIGCGGELVELFEESVESHALGRPFRAWGFVGALFLGRCPRLG